MDWARFAVTTDPENGELILVKMLELGAGGVEEIDPGSFASVQADLPEELRMDNPLPGEYRVVGYWPAENRREIEARLRNLPGVKGLEVDLLNSSQWLNTNTIGFEELLIGKKWIVYPDQVKARIPEGRIPIFLSPGQAFGTGLHPSTQLVLELLEELPPGVGVLDAGTGSGILAIALAKLGWSEIMACDIDSTAVEVARLNLLKNGVSAQVLQADPRELSEKSFSLITANILAEVIEDLACSFAKLIGSGGSLIASGIIGEKSSQVRRSLHEAGFRVVREKNRDNWVAMVAYFEGVKP